MIQQRSLKGSMKKLAVSAAAAVLAVTVLAGSVNANAATTVNGITVVSIKTNVKVKQELATPKTIGSYTVSSTTTANSKLILTAKFPEQKDILVRVTKGDVVEKETFVTTSKKLDATLYLRHGQGKYMVEIFEKTAGAAGSYKGVIFGKSAFNITNTDTRDMEFLLPTTYVQSDHPTIIKLAGQITKGLKTDADKTKAIHDWVAQNIAYDVKSFTNNSTKLYTSTEILDRMIDVCSGYTNLTAALNRAVGIKTKIIIGTSIWTDQGETWATTKKKNNHAWVEVSVDGEWIIQDPTWNAGYINTKTNKFTFDFSEKYYDPTAKEFAKTHRKSEVSSM